MPPSSVLISLFLLPVFLSVNIFISNNIEKVFKLLKDMAVSCVIILAIVIPIVLLVEVGKLDDLVLYFFWQKLESSYIVGGAILGSITGAVLGLSLGLSFLINRLRRYSGEV